MNPITYEEFMHMVELMVATHTPEDLERLFYRITQDRLVDSVVWAAHSLTTKISVRSTPYNIYHYYMAGLGKKHDERTA